MHKVYNVELKTTEELCIMILKADVIFKEKLIGSLKNGIKIWLIFIGTVESLKICTLMAAFVNSI